MKPAVSVFFMTYNHAPYVKQALESVANQKTDFSFEIVIGDDFSTDGGREIILETIKPFSDRVKLLFQEKNTGGHPNQEAILRGCTSKYMAIIEGDDYWTDDTKLQKQYDLFESRPDANVVFHDVDILFDDGRFSTPAPIPKSLSGRENEYTREDLARSNFIPTVSVMYRNLPHFEFPQWFYSSKIGDYYLHFLYADGGKIIRVPERMAVYRSHGKGVWTGKSFEANARNFLYLINHMVTDAGPALRPHFAYHKASVMWNTALRFFHEGEVSKYQEFAALIKETLDDMEAGELAALNRTMLDTIPAGRKIELYLTMISRLNGLKSKMKKVFAK